jgi:hypothetical protein
MAGTVKMGQRSDPEACVDHDLRVFGVKSLRVADMSVVPITPKYVSASSDLTAPCHQFSCKGSQLTGDVSYSNHTQTTAYYVGATAGDKIAAEYGLDVAEVNGA